MKGLLRKLSRWSSRTKMLAVSENDIEPWLESLGVLEAVQAGTIHCMVCKRTISLETIQLISRAKDQIVFCCTNPTCISRFEQSIQSKQP